MNYFCLSFFFLPASFNHFFGDTGKKKAVYDGRLKAKGSGISAGG